METLAASFSLQSPPSSSRLRRRDFPVAAAAGARSCGSLCCSRRRLPSPSIKCSVVSGAASSASVAPTTASGEGDDEEENRFTAAAKDGNLVPLFRCIFSDHLTPVLAYRCLVAEDDWEAPSFLFESVEQGSTGINVGRYSVVGANPAMEVVAKENRVVIMDHEEGKRTEELVDDPMLIPRRITEGWNPQGIDELPRAFCGGWVGFFSYDSVRYVETKKLPFSKSPNDDRNLPDVHLGLYNDVIVFDHVEKLWAPMLSSPSSQAFLLGKQDLLHSMAHEEEDLQACEGEDKRRRPSSAQHQSCTHLQQLFSLLSPCAAKKKKEFLLQLQVFMLS